jgi:hypothetical protein
MVGILDNLDRRDGDISIEKWLCHEIVAEAGRDFEVFGRSLYPGFPILQKNTACCVLVSLGVQVGCFNCDSLMTADVPYSKLVNLGNVGLGGVTQLAYGDLGAFLAGLQHSLIVLSLLILGSAIFSFLRGPRTESQEPPPQQV